MKVHIEWTIDRSVPFGVLLAPSHEEGESSIETEQNTDLLEYLLDRVEKGDLVVTEHLRLWGLLLPEIKTNNRSGITTCLKVEITKKVTITHEEIEPNVFMVHFHPKGVEVTREFITELYMP